MSGLTQHFQLVPQPQPLSAGAPQGCPAEKQNAACLLPWLNYAFPLVADLYIDDRAKTVSFLKFFILTFSGFCNTAWSRDVERVKLVAQC